MPDSMQGLLGPLTLCVKSLHSVVFSPGDLPGGSNSDAASGISCRFMYESEKEKETETHVLL